MADDTTDVVDDDSTDDDGATPQLGDAGKKAIEAERTRARDAERRAKVAERELEKLRTASLSDQERAVAEAEARGRTEGSQAGAKRIARAEIRAQGALKGLDVTALLEDVDLTRFVGDDGEPDDKAIAKAIDRWAGINSKPSGDIGQGHRPEAKSNDMNQVIRDLINR